MYQMSLAAYALANKPLSRAKISLKVKVPTIVPVEADHRPSALRKIPPLLAEEAWTVRLAYTGGERIKLTTERRDRNVRSGIIVRSKIQAGKVRIVGGGESRVVRSQRLESST